jgi:ubiquinone/menaquinone biosynthesis C-methylase UbiE
MEDILDRSWNGKLLIKTKGDMYKSKILRELNGIPIFSEADDYIKNYDEISADHMESLKQTGENPFMSEAYWDELENSTVEQLKPHLFSGAKILDVGVGLGRLLDKLDPKLEKFGIDISEQYLAESKKKGINVCMAKIEDMPYEDNLFDFVVSTDVLEHVFDLNQCIEQILRVLKPGGILLMRVPFKENLDVYLSFNKYQYVHLRNFDEGSIRLLFTKIFDCEVLDVKTMGMIPNPLKMKSPMLINKGRIFRLTNLLKIFMVNLLEKGSSNDFFVKLVDTKFWSKYNRINRLKSNILFWVLDKFVTAGEAYHLDDFYERIEISVVVKKN